MTLVKLQLSPDRDSYSFNDGNDTIYVKLEGGRSKFRRDILNSNLSLNVQWTLDRDEYNYLRIFYKSIVEDGSLPFLLDLYINDGYELSEHEVNIIPGSFGLKSQKGHAFVVGCTLEVKPIALTDLQIYSAYLYGSFGMSWAEYLDSIDNLINYEIPGDFNDGIDPVITNITELTRTDWQGEQILYATARTNNLKNSQNQSEGTYIHPNSTLTASIADPAGGTNAFTLTATSAGGNISCAALISIPTGTRVNSVWIRRRTGTGTVSVLAPNGSTWTPVAVTTAWARVTVTGASGSGTSDWGVKLATSGDEVDIAFGQNEPGSAATSYIPTTSSPATVTDYLKVNNCVVLNNIPLIAASIKWSGTRSINGVISNITDELIGTGNNVDRVFDLASV